LVRAARCSTGTPARFKRTGLLVQLSGTKRRNAVERFENPIELFRDNSGSGVCNRYHHSTIMAHLRRHTQDSWSRFRYHRIHSVSDQIQKKLLQLDTISHYPGLHCIQLGLNDDLMPLQVSANESKRLLDQIVDVA
jgi:hypothetical protein